MLRCLHRMSGEDESTAKPDSADSTEAEHGVQSQQMSLQLLLLSLHEAAS